MTERRDMNWCLGCHALDSEPAGEDCKNPAWHIPDPKVYPPKPAETEKAK